MLMEDPSAPAADGPTHFAKCMPTFLMQAALQSFDAASSGYSIPKSIQRIFFSRFKYSKSACTGLAQATLHGSPAHSLSNASSCN